MVASALAQGAWGCSEFWTPNSGPAQNVLLLLLPWAWLVRRASGVLLLSVLKSWSEIKRSCLVPYQVLIFSSPWEASCQLLSANEFVPCTLKGFCFLPFPPFLLSLPDFGRIDRKLGERARSLVRRAVASCGSFLILFFLLASRKCTASPIPSRRESHRHCLHPPCHKCLGERTTSSYCSKF